MRILVVDDSRAMRMLVMRTIRQTSGAEHVFDEASNGREALERIAVTAPDLVVSGCHMPTMSGLELLRTLRERDSPIKFGFVTADQSLDMLHDASQAGALFLIVKPFNEEIFRKELGPILAGLSVPPLAPPERSALETPEP
jgi:two-component system, chemotaxis family, chemotaxis protein CheY